MSLKICRIISIFRVLNNTSFCNDTEIFENEEQSLRLPPVEQKNIELSFSGERISSDGGLLLLREVNRQIGLIEQISNCITDNRDQRYIDHTIEELVSQRAYQIAAGYEDCNDSDELRHNQILKTCVGRLPQTGKDLGSQPTTILKPGRRSKQSDVASILKRLILQIREQWPETRIIIRGDSHFASKDLMDWCVTSAKKVNYITGLAGNSKLKSSAQVTIESAEREFKQYGKPVKRYHSFMYKAESWASPKKVVVKVEASAQGTNIRYIVTNLTQFKAKGLYEKGYCARGAAELRIKEHKLYLKSDRASCTSFKANQFRLFLHSIAYVLMHTMQKELFKGTELVNATFKTLQNKIIKTAAWVKEMKTKIKIEFPKYCPTKELQARSFQMLGMLVT